MSHSLSVGVVDINLARRKRNIIISVGLNHYKVVNADLILCLVLYGNTEVTRK